MPAPGHPTERSISPMQNGDCRQQTHSCSQNFARAFGATCLSPPFAAGFRCHNNAPQDTPGGTIGLPSSGFRTSLPLVVAALPLWRMVSNRETRQKVLGVPASTWKERKHMYNKIAAHSIWLPSPNPADAASVGASGVVAATTVARLGRHRRCPLRDFAQRAPPTASWASAVPAPVPGWTSARMCRLPSLTSVFCGLGLADRLGAAPDAEGSSLLLSRATGSRPSLLSPTSACGHFRPGLQPPPPSSMGRLAARV